MGNTRNKGKTCRVLGCEDPARSKELCSVHYQRWIKTGRVEVGPSHRLVQTAKGRTCNVAECGQPVRSKGLCESHYARMIRSRECPICGDRMDLNSTQCRQCQQEPPPIPVDKSCPLCGEVKTIKDFGWRKDSQGRSKIRSRCRTCESTYQRLRHRDQRSTDPEGYRKRKKESAERTYQRADPETRVLRSLMASARVWGVNRDDVIAAWEKTGNVCQSCGDQLTWEKRVVLDHCHRTGVFRGLLCHPCNVAAGWVRDDPQRARQLALYLERPLIETETT